MNFIQYLHIMEYFLLIALQPFKYTKSLLAHGPSVAFELGWDVFLVLTLNLISYN